MARVAEALETLPALARAAEDGTLSFYELRLLTRYATPESDEACVRLAGDYTVGQCSVCCGTWRVRWTTRSVAK